MTPQSSPGEGLTDEQIEALRDKANTPFGCGILRDEANALCDMALRVRALENDLADALDCKRGTGPTALSMVLQRALEAESRAEASAKDAGRIDFMQKAMLAADFGYGDPAETVLVFKWPDTPVGADLRKNIDATKEQKRG